VPPLRARFIAILDAARDHVFSFNLGEPVGQNSTASVFGLRSKRVVATIDLPGAFLPGSSGAAVCLDHS